MSLNNLLQNVLWSAAEAAEFEDDVALRNEAIRDRNALRRFVKLRKRIACAEVRDSWRQKVIDLRSALDSLYAYAAAEVTRTEELASSTS